MICDFLTSTMSCKSLTSLLLSLSILSISGYFKERYVWITQIGCKAEESCKAGRHIHTHTHSMFSGCTPFLHLDIHFFPVWQFSLDLGNSSWQNSLIYALVSELLTASHAHQQMGFSSNCRCSNISFYSSHLCWLKSWVWLFLTKQSQLKVHLLQELALLFSKSIKALKSLNRYMFDWAFTEVDLDLISALNQKTTNNGINSIHNSLWWTADQDDL